jgi:hypothetical protein
MECTYCKSTNAVQGYLMGGSVPNMFYTGQ